MALVSAAAARALLAGFRGVGLDAEAIREAAGISRSALEPVDGVLPAEAFGRMWQDAFRRAPREELPTEVGIAVPFGAFGPLDYLAASSADVASAFDSLAAWFRTVASGFSLEVVRAGGGGEVRVVWSPGGLPPGRPREVSDEFTIAVTVGRFRSRPVSHPFRASEIRLTRPAPARPTRHEALLGTAVAFGCAVAAVRVPKESWEAKLPGADPMLQETLRGLAQRLELGSSASDLEQAVRARLRSLLPEGGGDARAVARSLGMSVRTLHRRLRAAGRSFGEVVDLFRESEAERLLAARAATLAEVGYRLGFSDQSAFTRAFRRWKGAPPSAWLGTRRARAPRPARAGTSKGRSRPPPS
ncbi:MAG TPA: AraC family transcriptional regulator ligand-binding domain-containing protein [Anaeromyxobacter sp.]